MSEKCIFFVQVMEIFYGSGYDEHGKLDKDMFRKRYKFQKRI